MRTARPDTARVTVNVDFLVFLFNEVGETSERAGGGRLRAIKVREAGSSDPPVPPPSPSHTHTCI